MSESMKKPRMTQEEEDEIESLTKSLVMRDKMKLPKIDKEVEQERPERLRPWFRERLKFHRNTVRNS
nr:DNA polymerase III subunit theta [Morganella morganii]